MFAFKRRQSSYLSDEVGLNVLEIGGTVAQRGWYHRRPGVMDIPESQTVVVGQVVIDANEFFAPRGWCGTRSNSPQGKPPAVVFACGMSARKAAPVGAPARCRRQTLPSVVIDGASGNSPNRLRQLLESKDR